MTRLRHGALKRGTDEELARKAGEAIGADEARLTRGADLALVVLETDAAAAGGGGARGAIAADVQAGQG